MHKQIAKAEFMTKRLYDKRQSYDWKTLVNVKVNIKKVWIVYQIATKTSAVMQRTERGANKIQH